MSQPTAAITFDSKKEAARCRELCLLVRSGEINDLQGQVKFELSVNGMKVAHYLADFVYTDGRTNRRIVEDTKGVHTPVYRLKKRLMQACHGIEVLET
jgi:hypothetical protein